MAIDEIARFGAPIDLHFLEIAITTAGTYLLLSAETTSRAG